MLVLSVLDNGVGVREDDKQNLFKLFGCLKTTRKMNTRGVGLGLVISKMITEEFGGQVRLFSLAKVGSIFQSSFKLLEPEAMPPRAAPGPEASSALGPAGEGVDYLAKI